MSTTRPRSLRRCALARRLDQRRLAIAISAARELVARNTPFSPSWDAAMAALEDLQREHRMLRGKTPRR
jgi:hypothetical protein